MDHDPDREPFASMTREEIMALMSQCEDPQELESLNAYLMDKLTGGELETINHANRIAASLIREYDAFGNGQCVFLCGIAGEVAAKVAKEMPPRGKPAECN
jgi:hypothetical protein